MRRFRPAALAATLLLTAAGPVPAQDAGSDTGALDLVEDNPHGAEFRVDCNICHVLETWSPAKLGSEFDHTQFGYALDGAHLDSPCLLCHVDLKFQPVFGTRCDECHQDVHAGELGTECQECHSTRSFVDRTDDLRSHRFTRFPLTGTHATVDCASCHGPGGATSMRFANTPTDCFTCHQDDYQAAVPTHTLPEFPTECMLCHDTFSWAGGPAGAPFDHNLTRFPLTGAHRTVTCEGCHSDGQYAGAPVDCFACHSDDYQNTTSPVHTPEFFPIDCAQCHGTTSWLGGTFDLHDASFFPIFSGTHQNVWSQDCASCHQQPSDFRVFTCTDCHYHVQSAEDPRHQGIGGYSYQTSSCFACHPTGDG